MATTKKQAHYRNVGDRPVELVSGRLLPVGESAAVDADGGDKALIDAGVLVPVETGEDNKEA